MPPLSLPSSFSGPPPSLPVNVPLSPDSSLIVQCTKDGSTDSSTPARSLSLSISLSLSLSLSPMREVGEAADGEGVVARGVGRGAGGVRV
jgi:hypothetical protein